METYSLNFSDLNFEKKFQNDTEAIKFLNFYKYLLSELFLFFLITLFNMFYEGYQNYRVGLLILIILFGLFIYFISKKLRNWKYVHYLFLFIHLMIIVCMVQSLSNVYIDQPFYKIIVIIYSDTITQMLSSMILAKIKWHNMVFIYFWYNVYIISRYYTLEDMNTYPIIFVVKIFDFLIFSFKAFSLEKTNRELYQMLSQMNKRLNNYQSLLKNIFPIPIIIFNEKNDNTEFFNNSALEFYKTYYDLHNSENMINTISNENQNILKYDDKEIFSVEKVLNQFKLCENTDTKDESLKEKLKEYMCKDNNYKFFQLDQTEKLDFYQLNVFFEETQKKYFILKFLKIIWNEKQCVLLIIDDITNINEIKELRNLDEYKNRLLATVSHDLRTPLNGMLGMIEIVMTEITDKKNSKNMEIAYKSGQLLLNMINDFLDFSQINNQKLRLNFQKIDILQLIKETVKMIKFQFKRKELQLILDLPESINTALVSDCNRIKQILLNLLSNSLKFTSKGYVKLSLTEDQIENRYLISVEDTGVGIKEEDIPKLFKLFGKLDTTSYINKTGVGLGLTISQTLVKMLNKEDNKGIFVESKYGKGTKFWFYLEGNEIKTKDLINDNDIISKIKINPSPSVLLKIKETKVLLVDDDLVNLMIGEKYCEFYGISYFIANNGLEAFLLIEREFIINKNQIDIIFMDVNMPLMDGYNASMKINKLLQDSKKKKIPIVGMSANNLNEDTEKCIANGMTDFLAKPVSRKDFGLMVEKILNVKIL